MLIPLFSAPTATSLASSQEATKLVALRHAHLILSISLPRRSHQSIHITTRRMAYQAMIRVAIKFLRREIQCINLRLLVLIISEDLVLV